MKEAIVAAYLYVTVYTGLMVGYPLLWLAEKMGFGARHYPEQIMMASAVGAVLVVLTVASLFFPPWCFYLLGAEGLSYVIGTYHTWKKWN